VQVADGDLGAHVPGPFDLILSAFTFDNVPGWEKKVALLSQLRARLAPGGRLVNLLSSPDIYTHEWLSFSTKDFPENHKARTGDVVRIIMLDVPDRRPVDDVLWERADFLEVYRRAGAEAGGGALPARAPRRAVRLGQRMRSGSVGDRRAGGCRLSRTVRRRFTMVSRHSRRSAIVMAGRPPPGGREGKNAMTRLNTALTMTTLLLVTSLAHATDPVEIPWAPRGAWLARTCTLSSSCRVISTWAPPMDCTSSTSRQEPGCR
jgi:hypothetical protein